MHLLGKSLRWLLNFFSGWQPRDYVTTALALAALIISLRKELKDRSKVRVEFAFERNSTSFEDVYKVFGVLTATNVGGQPVILRWAGAELWDSQAKQFFRLESDETFTLQRAESAIYRMELGPRIIGDTRPHHNLLVFDVQPTAVLVMDTTGHRWNMGKRDLAMLLKGYPAFDFKNLDVGKWPKRWLLIRLHLFSSCLYAWRLLHFRRISRSWRELD